MTMRVLYGAGPEDIAGYDTERLRETFLIGDLFEPDAVRFIYTHVDRLVLGGPVLREHLDDMLVQGILVPRDDGVEGGDVKRRRPDLPRVIEDDSASAKSGAQIVALDAFRKK